MADAQFSCSTFTDRGTTYFAAVTLHNAQEGAEGSADLALTDGAAAWTAQGGLPSRRLIVVPGSLPEPVMPRATLEACLTLHRQLLPCRPDL